jgi:hypothetical protein
VRIGAVVEPFEETGEGDLRECRFLSLNFFLCKQVHAACSLLSNVHGSMPHGEPSFDACSVISVAVAERILSALLDASCREVRDM